GLDREQLACFGIVAPAGLAGRRRMREIGWCQFGHGNHKLRRPAMTYRASDTRYDAMEYRRTGQWGLKLPAISLGLWQNFGGTRDYPSAFEILGYAFDHGVTHFDLANN